MIEVPQLELPKPRFRGRFHQVAFFVAIPAGIVLVALASTAAARVAAIIYAVSLIGLYGSSAAYHRRQWSTRARRRMKRLDHSMIFVLIAGSYTPFALLVLPKPWSIVLLALVWAGAGAGILLKMVRIDGFKIASGTLYIALGWVSVLAMPMIVRRLSLPAVILLFCGGLLYTVGATVLARHRPRGAPAIFGYHEIWHSFVVGASGCHYAMVLMIVLAARPAITA